MKQKSVFVCGACGAEHLKWAGQCSQCKEWGTLEEQVVSESELKASRQVVSGNLTVTSLAEGVQTDTKRIITGISELDNAIGGGLVGSQVILLSGEPGVGKSTLLMQVSTALHQQGVKTLYVSGEESLGQVAARARRLFPEQNFDDLLFAASPGVHNLILKIAELKPQFVVVDSIQTMYDEGLSSLPGSLTQVKAATSELVRAAKDLGFILVIVGHINKSGSIAGPKALEHLVDSVLQFEGERDAEYRVLRVLKNRFGSTGEVGLLVMTAEGLVDMDAKYNIFDGGAEDGVGTAKTLVVEGNRPIVVQVQALTNDTVFAYPKRVAEGVSVSRLQLICAILDRFTGAKLGTKDVYLRTAGDYKLRGAAADLAIAAAILSSLKGVELPASSLYVGELSLSGNISLPRTVSARLPAIAKLGVSHVIGPVTKPKGSKFTTTEVKNLTGLSKLLK